jgi:hypothetical protein
MAAGVCISMDRGVFIERLWRSFKHEHVYLKGYADGHEAQAGIGPRFAFYNIARPAHADGCLAGRDQQWIPRYDCGHDAALGQRFGVPHAHSRNNSNSTLRLDQFMRTGRQLFGGQIGSAINERLVIFRGRYGTSYCLGRHRISPPYGSRWTRRLSRLVGLKSQPSKRSLPGRQWGLAAATLTAPNPDIGEFSNSQTNSEISRPWAALLKSEDGP